MDYNIALKGYEINCLINQKTLVGRSPFYDTPCIRNIVLMYWFKESNNNTPQGLRDHRVCCLYVSNVYTIYIL